MSYQFSGNMGGMICGDCCDPLAKVTVRLYKTGKVDKLPTLVAANPKATFKVLAEKEIKAKEPLLLGEAVTDEKGDFTFNVSDNEYDGSPVEIDVYIKSLPHQGKRAKPVQFTITTLQPQWRMSDNDFVAGWRYCIPSRFWCYILSLFDIWVICGRVVLCENPKLPFIGVKVRAFDADWITDDELGYGITDNNGSFRIYYNSIDFQQTFLSPWINIETPFPPFNSGPDVYFKIETTGGFMLREETRSDGQVPGRENIGNCFCVSLCISRDQIDEPPTQIADSAWTGIGTAFTIPDASALNDFDAQGYAGSLKFAFTRVIRTTGQSLRFSNGNPIEYRFLVSHTTALNGTPFLPNTDFTTVVGLGAGQDLFVSTRIGQMWRFSPSFKIVNIYAVLADLDADGWLDVNKSIERTFTADPLLDPLELSIPGMWQWVDLDGMIAINTAKFINHADIPFGSSNPGDPVPSADQLPIQKMSIRFETREVINKATNTYVTLPGSGMTLNSMVVNNNQALMKLAMKEHLSIGACSPLSGDVHAVYTVSHPHLDDVTITARKNSDPSATSLSAAPIPLINNTNTALDHINNSLGIKINDFLTMSKCTYIVKLHVRRRLHTGDGQVSGTHVDTSFYWEP
jgi:hypothetical protein